MARPTCPHDASRTLSRPACALHHCLVPYVYTHTSDLLLADAAAVARLWCAAAVVRGSTQPVLAAGESRKDSNGGKPTADIVSSSRRCDIVRWVGHASNTRQEQKAS